jgi:glycerate kinase
MAALDQLLTTANLTSYTSALMTLGVTGPADIADMDDEELTDIGLTKVEVRRLRRELARAKVATMSAVSSPAPAPSQPAPVPAPAPAPAPPPVVNVTTNNAVSSSTSQSQIQISRNESRDNSSAGAGGMALALLIGGACAWYHNTYNCQSFIFDCD